MKLQKLPEETKDLVAPVDKPVIRKLKIGWMYISPDCILVSNHQTDKRFMVDMVRKFKIKNEKHI